MERLLTDILRYNLMPDADLGTRIFAATDAIERSIECYPQTLSEPLQLMIRHAGIIRRQRLVEDVLLTRIDGLPTAQEIDVLSGALDKEFREALLDKQRYRTYLFIYSGFLLMLLTYANRRLPAANETLEQRVAEATLRTLRAMSHVGGQPVRLSASIGISSARRRQPMPGAGSIADRGRPHDVPRQATGQECVSLQSAGGVESAVMTLTRWR